MHIGQITKYIIELRLRNEEASKLYCHLLPWLMQNTHCNSQTYLTGHADGAVFGEYGSYIAAAKPHQKQICALKFFGTECILQTFIKEVNHHVP